MIQEAGEVEEHRWVWLTPPHSSELIRLVVLIISRVTLVEMAIVDSKVLVECEEKMVHLGS